GGGLRRRGRRRRGRDRNAPMGRPDVLGRPTSRCHLRAQARGPTGPFGTRDRRRDRRVGQRRGNRSGTRLPPTRLSPGQSGHPRVLRPAGLRTSRRPDPWRAANEPVRATGPSMTNTYTVAATDGEARAGVLRTAHGDVPTPAFMPVGTKATVKTVDPDELRALGATIVLGNTYHLHFRPGEDLIAELGGLHRFMGWDGPILTDSGGFQVFSLRDTLASVDDDGVTFRSVYDGALARFTPELVADVQAKLGSDVAMCLDVCPPARIDPAELEEAVRLTTAWATRQRE